MCNGIRDSQWGPEKWGQIWRTWEHGSFHRFLYMGTKTRFKTTVLGFQPLGGGVDGVYCSSSCPLCLAETSPQQKHNTGTYLKNNLVSKALVLWKNKCPIVSFWHISFLSPRSSLSSLFAYSMKENIHLMICYHRIFQLSCFPESIFTYHLIGSATL